jgi:hypothetical protein
MTGVRVTHGLDDLEADMRYIARTARGDMRKTVRDGIRAGNELAKDSAKRNNPPGSHSHQYPGKFSAEMHAGLGLFGNTISGEYGPEHSGQGELAPILENGSRKGNAAQQNLARSTDIIGPAFAQEVSKLPDRWFWPDR